MTVLLVACTGTSPDATPPPAADPLLERAGRDGGVVVIVQLAVPAGSDGTFDTDRIARAQRHLVSELGTGGRVVERFRRLPQMVLRVDPTALQELRQSGLVVNISLNETEKATQ